LKAQEEIEKIIIILPPTFNINELENTLCYENKMFYYYVDNDKFLDAIIDPENYTYSYSRIKRA
jgi:hypothetical protein